MKREDFLEQNNLTPALIEKYRQEQAEREKHKKCVRISKNCIVLASIESDDKKVIDKYKTTY